MKETAMSALAVHEVPAQDDDQGEDQGWEGLIRVWEQTDAPEGCKVEIIEGIITVAPMPTSNHNAVIWKLARHLTRNLPEGLGIYQNQNIIVPSREGNFVPDLLVAPEDALDGVPSSGTSPDVVELVVEVTSPSNARHDRRSKRIGYAQAGVPLYLLVDLHAPSGPLVTLYGEPSGDVYRVLAEVKFGEEIHLPAPFELTLDTSEFPTVK
jgi:Uma2 family endonuclease